MSKVFVLGAGVSHSAGLPLAAHMLTAVAETTLSQPERAELDDFLEYLMPTFEKEVANYPDVEEFLTLLEVAESYAQFSRAKLAFPRRRLAKLKRTFLGGLARYLWGGHEAVTADHPITLLVQTLKPSDIVITFNYDLTVERAISNLDRTWDYKRGAADITLLKPHGSIDWFHADEVEADGDRFVELFTDLTWFDGWNLERQKLGRSLPVIVPPVVAKLLDDPDLQAIWMEVGASIARADAIYILGYSLPQADTLTRFVLRRAISSRKKSGNIWAVNPDGHLRSRFAECISPDVAFVQQKFENWVQGFHESEAQREELLAEQS